MYYVMSTEGNCVSFTNPDAFFETGENAKLALKLCKGCPVIQECLNLAIQNQEQWGVWGGTTPYQRRKMQKQNRIVASKLQRQMMELLQDGRTFPNAS